MAYLFSIGPMVELCETLCHCHLY